jgi:hypothetical protein
VQPRLPELVLNTSPVLELPGQERYRPAHHVADDPGHDGIGHMLNAGALFGVHPELVFRGDLFGSI